MSSQQYKQATSKGTFMQHLFIFNSNVNKNLVSVTGVGD